MNLVEVANWMALEVCIEVHREKCNIARDGNENIHEGSKWSPGLASAC